MNATSILIRARSEPGRTGTPSKIQTPAPYGAGITVRPYHELEYVSACKELNVDIFVIGEDWGNKPYNRDVESYLKAAGKQIVQVLYNPQTSSTKIKQKVIAQTLVEVNYA